MAKIVKIIREVRDNMDGDDVEVKKVGEDTYKIYTGQPTEHGFSNKVREERFRERFIEKFNETAEKEDDIRFNPDNFRSREEMRSFQRGLEQDQHNFDLRVSL